jgi:hypothetical protein
VLVDGENYHRLREPSAQADTRRDRPATGRGPTGQVFGDLPDKWFLSHLAGLIPLPFIPGRCEASSPESISQQSVPPDGFSDV